MKVKSVFFKKGSESLSYTVDSKCVERIELANNINFPLCKVFFIDGHVEYIYTIEVITFDK